LAGIRVAALSGRANLRGIKLARDVALAVRAKIKEERQADIAD
jgi:hypothetical protein